MLYMIFYLTSTSMYIIVFDVYDMYDVIYMVVYV